MHVRILTRHSKDGRTKPDHSTSLPPSVSSATQSCLTLCNPLNCSPTDSSVHGILQARIPEWVAKPSSRESCRPRDQTPISYVSCTAGGFFATSATREARDSCLSLYKQRQICLDSVLLLFVFILYCLVRVRRRCTASVRQSPWLLNTENNAMPGW